jgi:hypothetical protein
MIRLIRAVLLLSATLVSTLAAADLTGAWTLELDPDFGGVRNAVECTFKQDSEALTVDCGGGGPPITGEVNDQRVTLRVKTGRNNELTATFVGTLDERATAITGSWKLTDYTGERDGKFTARKH